MHKQIQNKQKVLLKLICISILLTTTHTTLAIQSNPSQENQNIPYHKIIQEGQTLILQTNSNPKDLTIWYNNHPNIEFASQIQNTITLKFIDGTYILLINPKNTNHLSNSNTVNPTFLKKTPIQTSEDKTALILNPSENMYGNLHCKRIIFMLQSKNYNITHKINNEVTIPFLRYNFSANIIYMNTHAGVWDLDGDQQPDIVVIGTGEHWTNETPDQYKFEYDNQMIVEGLVGDTSFISFTPYFINHYYQNNTIPDSLIYMATCHATYDDTMAQAYLNAGAETYLGWTQNTVFWTNSLTSILTFRLLSLGFTINQICKFIGYGGFYNFIFQSKLTYYGNGNYVLPD